MLLVQKKIEMYKKKRVWMRRKIPWKFKDKKKQKSGLGLEKSWSKQKEKNGNRNVYRKNRVWMPSKITLEAEREMNENLEWSWKRAGRNNETKMAASLISVWQTKST